MRPEAVPLRLMLHLLLSFLDKSTFLPFEQTVALTTHHGAATLLTSRLRYPPPALLR